jgi:hypothetical protein
MNEPLLTDCIALGPQTLLIAAPDGRCWLATVGSSALIALPASAVEGAIAAGLAATGRAVPDGSYTLLRYIRWLAGNYVFAGQTPGLFRRGAERLEAAGRPDLAAFAHQKAEEETGHAELAYRDLAALGLPAGEVIRLVAPPSANAFADGFRSHVESTEPIALFGFSYCLERMAIGRDAAFIQRIEAVCPPQARAYRFLKVHSTVGSDAAHVHEQLAVFESLRREELATVARAAYETAEMLAQQSTIDEVVSDEEINRRLRAAGIEIFSLPGRGGAAIARAGCAG